MRVAVIEGWDREPRHGAAMGGVPATAGEFVQGIYRGKWMHVCCPISRIRWARCSTTPDHETQSDGSFTKTVNAIERLIESQQAILPSGSCLEVRMGGMAVRRGAGMGSSSADVGAGLAAANAHLGADVSAEGLARIAVAVEPTNGSLVPGIALFDHRGAEYVEVLGAAPSLKVVTLDPGGVVDSLEFNRRLRARPPSTATATWNSAFELVRHGVSSGDSAAVARAASLSARVAASIHDPQLVAAVDALAVEVGALGMCVSHSGTAVSLLFDGDESPGNLAESAHRLADLVERCRVFVHDVVDGGPRYDAA